MEIIERFRQFLLSQKSKPSKFTIKNYLADVKQFISWYENDFGKKLDYGSITPQVIGIFKEKNSLSPRSLERHLSSLRKFFIFLKTDGIISASPFSCEAGSGSAREQADPYRLKDFKSFLYVYNASHLTIKNYIIDIKQFLRWAEEVTGIKEAWDVREKNLFSWINPDVVEEYKQRLIESGFSPLSINRKLSSLRRYLGWATEEGLLKSRNKAELPANWRTQNNAEGNFRVVQRTVSRSSVLEDEAEAKELEMERQYSRLAPIRFAQKLTKSVNFLFDSALITPLSLTVQQIHYIWWKLRGKPVFKKVSSISNFVSGSQKADPNQILNTKFQILPLNIRKVSYAPLTVSAKYFPWHKKLLHHARYTRPNWYKQYHSYPVTHYFHFAVLVIFMSALGFGFYQNFLVDPKSKSPVLAAAVSPLKILSFQGRLTDESDNPITAAKWIRVVIYNDTSASGAARLWEEVEKVSPDTDGIFSILLGDNGSGANAALCNSGEPPTSPPTGACGIPQTLFAQNAALWLGVTVEDDPELSPRQQLATVAYATNAETLQGLPPITDAGVTGNTNAVLALNSSGQVSIAGTGTTVFQSTGGQLTVTGKTLLLNTASETNIEFEPDGLGKLDIQKPILNSTNNSNILTAQGGVEIDDIFAVLATSSAQSAFTVNQDSTGPLISASTSGTAKFTVDNGGNTTLAGDLAVNGETSADITSITTTASLFDATVTTLNIGAAATSWDIGAGTGTGTVNNATLAITGLIDANGAGTHDIAGTLNLSGNTLTSTTDLTINSGDGQILFANGDVFNIGGVTALAYNAISDSGTTGHALASDNDLYIEGDVEIDGTLYVDGNLVGPATGTSGYWQRALGALAPTNITDDLLIGGTASSSAKFQVFGVGAYAGTASSSGSLTFNDAAGTNPSINIFNSNRLDIKTSVGGDGGLGAVMSILNNGNVGIGTTGPAAKLEVRKSGTGTSPDANATIGIVNNGIAYLNLYDSAQDVQVGVVNNSGYGYVGTLGAQRFSLATDNAERLTVLPTSGYVGINDNSPDYLLELYDATNTPAFALSDDDVGHGVTTIAQTDVFAHLSSISTTVGGAQLTGLADATGIALGLKGVQSADPTDTTPAISLIGTKANDTGVQDLADAETVLQIANNDNAAAFTVLGNGNIGIGTAGPAAPLDVFGTKTLASDIAALKIRDTAAYNSGGPGGALIFMGKYDSAGDYTNFGAISGFKENTTDGNYSSALGFYTRISGASVTEQMRIDSTGNVGIGTTGPTGKLHVDGTNVGKALAIFNETGTNDIVTASASGVTKFRVLNTGSVYASAYYDIDNTGYFLDPAATGTSLATVGNAGFGDDTPDYRLEISDTTNTPAFALSDDDVTHGVTTLAETDVFGHISSISTTVGGLQITGLADATGVALGLKGVQSADPTDTTPAISLIGTKANGTGVQDLGQIETLLQIANNDNAAAFTVLGDGSIGMGTATPIRQLELTGSLASANSLNVISRPNEIRAETYRAEDITGWNPSSGGAVTAQAADATNGLHTRFQRFTSNADGDANDRIFGDTGAHSEDFVDGKTYLISFMYRATNSFCIRDRDTNISTVPANTGKAKYFETQYTKSGTAGSDRFLVFTGSAGSCGADNNQVDIGELTIQNLTDDAPASRFFASASTTGNSWFNAGNLGIGTVGPDKKMDILDTSGAQLRLTYTDGTTYTDLQTDTNGFMIFDSTGNRMEFKDYLSVWAGASTAQILGGYVDGDAAYRYTIDAAGKTSWGPGSGATDTNLYRLAANWLKTDDSLAITGDASTSGSLVFDASKSIDILNGSKLDFQTSVGGDDGLAVKMTLLNNGNFGIGSTDPGYKLTVSDNTATYATDFLQNNADGWGSYIWVNNADTDKDALHVETTAGHPLVVKNSGSVGIGTTNPANALDVAGNMSVSGYYTSTSNLTLKASGATAGNGGNSSLYFQGSTGTQVGRLDTAAVSAGSGADGDLVISTDTTFAPGAISGVATTANSGQTDVAVTSGTNFSAGQEVLIIQVTGTGAGNWETKTIASKATNTLTMTANLTNTYTNDGSSKAQVQKIPQYGAVTVNNNTSWNAPAWNGTTGGVIWFKANTSVTVGSNASINGVGLGFSGGAEKAGGVGGASAARNGGAAATGNNGSGPAAGQLGMGGTGSGGFGINGTGSGAGGSGGSGAGGTGGGGSGGAHADSGTGTNGVSGAGGNGGNGTSNTITAGGAGAIGAGGVNGTSYGAADFNTSIFLGSGGGSGGSGAGGGMGGGGAGGAGGNGGEGGNGGPGGTGGAIISINTAKLINSGIISANGGTGTNGTDGITGVKGTNSASGSGGGGGGGAGGGAGGGGAGGAIWLNVQTMTLGTVTAQGGAGGSGGGNGGNGGNGGSGTNNPGGGGGGGAGRAGGIKGAAGSGGGGAQAGVNGATAAPGPGNQGGNGRIKLDGNASGSTTPASGSNGTYTPSSTLGYGTLYIGTVNTSQADVAENYRTLERDLEPGDVVIIDDNPNDPLYTQQYVNKEGPGIARARQERDGRVVGVISTAPGIVLGNSDQNTPPDEQKALALAGRVPVKIASTSAEIKVGDLLTSSNIPGRAQKAILAGTTIGKALEAWTPGSGVDRINMLVNLSWYDPDVYLADTGNLVIQRLASSELASSSADLASQVFDREAQTESGETLQGSASAGFGGPSSVFRLLTSAGQIITRVGAFGEAAIGNLRAGLIRSEMIISPIAKVDQIHTNIISPLAQNSVVIKLGENNLLASSSGVPRLEIQNSSGSAVATIDSSGNASFAGQLSSSSLLSNDATISGTLRAANIIADSIEGLEARISTIAANSLRSMNQESRIQATPSSNLNSLFIIPNSDAIDIASFSSQLAYVENLSASTLTVNQGLMVFGPTSLADVSVADQLSVGGNLILADNSINMLGGTLEIQPLKQGAISLMGGMVQIDTEGNLTALGNISVKGILSANIISPIPDSDLVIRLGNQESGIMNNGQNPNSSFVIHNSSNSAVLKVNQLGDVIASGAGSFAKLNLNPVSPALALSDSEVIATGSAGVATISAHMSELTIKNNLVTDKSLIYITPLADTDNQVLYLMRQTTGESFTVGISQQAIKELPFNWMMIN